MKKLLLLVIAAAFVFSLLANSWAVEMKMGFADKLRILFEYKKAKDLNAELENENQVAKEEFDIKAEEIKKLRDEMELLSESARREKEVELEAMLRELDEFRRAKQREIGRKYDEGIRDISKEISTICENYGKNKGYDAIIDTRATIYIPPSLDITDQILKELNK
ncbi:MAG: OmpH family outer membrane protein [Candidatus Omnitrophica bacterium]|nr:OmpH family outer membrane protein [Candidatus Omnitrophota bacterium]